MVVSVVTLEEWEFEGYFIKMMGNGYEVTIMMQLQVAMN